MNQKEDRIVVDIANDPILQSFIGYLAKEFEVMGYSDEQKVMRIAHLAADILNEKSASYPNHNYMLGEILRNGSGVCRHKAILTKVLCNKLLPHLPCALVGGKLAIDFKVDFGANGIYIRTLSGDEALEGHAWNVVELDGHKEVIVDPMRKCLAAADHLSDAMVQYYGAERLRTSITGDYE